jgi:hypothetical protein
VWWVLVGIASAQEPVWPDAPTEPQDDAAPAEVPLAVQGVVLAAGTGAPIAGARVALTAADGTSVVLLTDEAGWFGARGLEVGTWEVLVTGTGIVSAVASAVVAPGAVAELVLRPESMDAWQDVEHILAADDVAVLPGTNGDVVRVVQNLPGVARPPYSSGSLLIRGTAPEDSAYYVDGARVPLVFHFQGLASVINPDAIESVAYLPGSYGVRYGRTLGGLVDIRTASSLPRQSSGYGSVDLLQATAFVEQRLSDRTALTVSARRSYIDAVLGPILKDAAALRAPRYYDAQVRLLHATDAGTFDVMYMLSDDKFAVLGDGDQVDVGLSTSFQRLRTQWSGRSGDWATELTVFGGPQAQVYEATAGEAFERGWAVGARFETYRRWREGAPGLRFGVDTLAVQQAFQYGVSLFDAAETGDAGQGWLVQPAVYGELVTRTGAVEWTTGVRGDASAALSPADSAHTTWAFDPRLAMRAQASESTEIKAAVGVFSQAPELRAVLPSAGGNDALTTERAVQTSLGLDQGIGRVASVELTGFATALDDLVVGREDQFQFYSVLPSADALDIDPYGNEGTGTAVGGELLLQVDTGTTLAWLSGTVSRSVRTSRAEVTTVYGYDQPIVATALVSRELPRSWRLGARARYASGNPYTPISNRILDLESREWLPVYGETSSARLAPFMSLDLRVDKAWTFRSWTLSLYLDLQNATNRVNEEVMTWTGDHREVPVVGLPILPAFGVKGAW